MDTSVENDVASTFPIKNEQLLEILNVDGHENYINIEAFDDRELTFDQFSEMYFRRDTSYPSKKNMTECLVCKKSFLFCKIPSHALYHHATDWPYKCEFCCMKFYHRKVLVKHMRRNHSKKYDCEQCKLQFVSADELKKHFKIPHPIRVKHQCFHSLAHLRMWYVKHPGIHKKNK